LFYDHTTKNKIVKELKYLTMRKHANWKITTANKGFASSGVTYSSNTCSNAKPKNVMGKAIWIDVNT
jgi:hypothetical protein